jgi:DNA-directed RNA polymerase subunit RPC12/RpoP
MSDEIRCPSCGEDDDLQGSNVDDVITITCGSCQTEWERDQERRCPRCGAGDLYPVPVAILEKSRGTQLSIMSTRPEYLCWVCDRDLIDAQRRSGTPIMPDELPATK